MEPLMREQCANSPCCNWLMLLPFQLHNNLPVFCACSCFITHSLRSLFKSILGLSIYFKALLLFYCLHCGWCKRATAWKTNLFSIFSHWYPVCVCAGVRSQDSKMGANHSLWDESLHTKYGWKKVESQNPRSIPHPGNSTETSSNITIKLGQTDLKAAYPINPVTTALWRQAFSHSGPWATVDDLRYTSPSGDPWPLNPTHHSGSRLVVQQASWRIFRRCLIPTVPQGREVKPLTQRIFEEDLCKSKGVKCK